MTFKDLKLRVAIVAFVPQARSSAMFLLAIAGNSKDFVVSSNAQNIDTLKLHLSGRWLSGSPIIRIDMVLRVNLSRILQN